MHGLRGHPKHTWGGHSVPDNRSETETETETVPRSTSQNLLRRLRRGNKTAEPNRTEPSSSRSPFWPEEYLANDIPEARIWTYGYNADVIEGIFRASNKNNISNHGRDLGVRFERDVDNEVGSICMSNKAWPMLMIVGPSGVYSAQSRWHYR